MKTRAAQCRGVHTAAVVLAVHVDPASCDRPSLTPCSHVPPSRGRSTDPTSFQVRRSSQENGNHVETRWLEVPGRPALPERYRLTVRRFSWSMMLGTTERMLMV
ncbi:hypothetical protein ACQEVF_03490 [Nonomuraea polychroma]|uniref:hypothetical protein n=1 Tax=Nonomuraea polychroma TaxID=46176 RepID=UPI003D8D6C21